MWRGPLLISSFSHTSRPEGKALKHHPDSWVSATSGCSLSFDVERLKKLTKSRDGRVSLHGAPSVGGTESHSLGPWCACKELGCSELDAEVNRCCDQQDHPDPPEHANLLVIRCCATAVEHELWPDERHQANDCWYGDINIRHLSLLARTSNRCPHPKRSQRQEAEFGRPPRHRGRYRPARQASGYLRVLSGTPGTCRRAHRRA